MRKYKIFLGCILLCIPLYASEQTCNQWLCRDFDDAMSVSSFAKSIKITKHVVDINGDQLYLFFKNLYEKNNLSVISPQATLKIPKIIHQIWLGGPLPDAFKKFVATWHEHHLGGDWRYKLWTDEDVESFGLYNKKLYDESDSVGVKSDIFKWEIIYRYGGVYVDTDFECLKSLEILHYTYDFYTGIQPLDTQFLQLGAALYGAVPGHPILKHCIETIKDDWHKKGAPAKSGPIHFTKSFYAVAGQNNSLDIALPAYYFYPLGCEDTELKRAEWIGNGAYAVHHWAKSWMPAHYRLQQFKKLNNDQSVTTWNN
ncbi:MAG: glycosyltransferase [Candidatus Babeliales bacterium]|nr:glycosyltransferase [Candidatus Babeliales bacterium]